MKNVDLIKKLLKTQKMSISTNRRVLIADDSEDEWYMVYAVGPEDEKDFEVEERLLNPFYSGNSFKKALESLQEDIESYDKE